MILGIQGSPRRNGNTKKLLSAFMDKAENLGANTAVIDINRINVDCNCNDCADKKEEVHKEVTEFS